MGGSICSNPSSLVYGTRLGSVSKPRTSRKPWVSQWPGRIWAATFKSVSVCQLGLEIWPDVAHSLLTILGFGRLWRGGICGGKSHPFPSLLAMCTDNMCKPQRKIRSCLLLMVTILRLPLPLHVGNTWMFPALGKETKTNVLYGTV